MVLVQGDKGDTMGGTCYCCGRKKRTSTVDKPIEQCVKDSPLQTTPDGRWSVGQLVYVMSYHRTNRGQFEVYRISKHYIMVRRRGSIQQIVPAHAHYEMVEWETYTAGVWPDGFNCYYGGAPKKDVGCHCCFAGVPYRQCYEEESRAGEVRTSSYVGE